MADSYSEPLTERETEILSCLVEGLSDREIASRLHLAYRTVRWYNSQIYGKLGVSNRDEAVEQAQTHNLLNTVSSIASTTEIPHNLPNQATPFIGRKQELTDLARLIVDPQTQLITILAPGGMGKSRLALAVAEAQLRHFIDGVFFVELAPLSSPNDIVTAIADSVGFSFYSSDAPEQQLSEYLRKRSMLLVLDNFEHLLDGASLVTDMLRTAPDLTILATSREKLNLSNETIFVLSGLHFPSWETPEDALNYDAVRLFMQSVQRVRPDFTLHSNLLDHLARICRLTAGMPLALLLAAGWIDVLSLEQIAAELQAGIDILETELRDIPERHRSVRASFNYTWARLSEDERQVFMKLSVFKDGFTSEAAQVVCEANARHLRKLVDRALVQTLPTGRYKIHELLRQYAAEHLRNTGEQDRIKDLHCQYYLGFLIEHETRIIGPDQFESLAAVAADHENIYTAWRHGVILGQADAIRQSVQTLSVYAHSTSTQQIEVERLFRQAQERFDVNHYPRVWARVTLHQIFLLRHGVFVDRTNFSETTEHILAIALEHSDLEEVALAKKLLATSIWFRISSGAEPNAKQLIQESLSIYESLDLPYYASNAHKWLGMLSQNGNTALAHYEQSITVAREARLPLQVASTQANFVMAYVRVGRYAEAIRVSEDAIKAFRSLNDYKLEGYVQFLLSLAHFFEGRIAETHAYAEEAVNLLEKVGDSNAKSVRLTISGLLYSLSHDVPRASQEWTEIVAPYSNTFRLYKNVVLIVQALEYYGQKETSSAKRTALESSRESRNFQFLPTHITALTIISMLLADEGETQRAIELFSLAMTHPASPRGWLENMPLLTQRHNMLRQETAPDVYESAWQRGTQLDFEEVIAQLQTEYAHWID